MKMFRKNRYAVLAAGISMAGAVSATAVSTDPHAGVPPLAAAAAAARDAAAGLPSPDFAPIQRGVLSNGVEVMVAGRHTVPGVHVQLLFDAGTAADQGRKPGTANFAFSVLMNGMKRRNSGAHSADYGYGFCSLDSCMAGFHAADAASMPLARFADLVRNPAFRMEDIEHVRGRQLAFIAKYRTDPVSTAWRLIYPMLYGTDHAYASFGGRGTRESLASMDVDDLTAFRNAYVRPDNVKILVTGDTSLAQVLPQFDAAFGDWMPDATAVTKTSVAKVSGQARPRIVLVDNAGAEQSFVMGGLLAPPGRSTRLWIANDAFAESRLWSHGVTSHVQTARGQSPLLVQATVDTDDTADIVKVIHNEAMGVIGAHPLADGEIENARQRLLRQLAGPVDARTDLDLLAHVAEHDLPDNYWQTFRFDAAAVDRATAEATLSSVLRPDAMTWVIVGDRRKIEAPIRALNIGEVRVVDYDGAAVQE